MNCFLSFHFFSPKLQLHAYAISLIPLHFFILEERREENTEIGKDSTRASSSAIATAM